MTTDATPSTGYTTRATRATRATQGRQQAVSPLADLAKAAEKLAKRAARVDVLLADADPDGRHGPTDPTPTMDDPHRLPLADLRAARVDAELGAKRLVEEVAGLLRGLGSDFVT